MVEIQTFCAIIVVEAAISLFIRHTPSISRKGYSMKKLSKFQKILIFTGAAVLLVLICLLLSPEPEPYANITNAQWVQMCQEAYDSLYQKEYLHFTRHTADMSSSGNTTASAEIWYSGDNFFQRETLENGDLRAFLMKDGTYYRNRQKELAPAEWNTASGDPIFVRSSGAWSEEIGRAHV